MLSQHALVVPCVVSVSVLFTELHERAHTVLVLLIRMCIVYQQSMGILFALLHFMRVSLSISKLHECASSHCSLLWYKRYCFTNSLSEYWCHNYH
jgi:hypothetical protein